jgi:transposase
MLKASTLACAPAGAAPDPSNATAQSRGYWAQAPFPRDTQPALAPTLDAMIPANHLVRMLEEILLALDWTAWESRYARQKGQPPIHPRVVASVLLYGLLRGVRSSRQLEYLCNHSLDFLWLTQGHALDHSTLCKFRRHWQTQLKDLFRRVCRLAQAAGLVRLGEVMFDGTRVKAHNARNQTATAASLQERFAQLEAWEAELQSRLAALEAGDVADGQVYAPSETMTRLPQDLADAQARRARLQAAQRKVQELDEARRQSGVDPQKHPAQVCLSDPDAQVMPNKEGGYAPNYTPTVAVDAETGLIVDADVLAGVNEHAHVPATLERIGQTFGQRPEKFLADAASATGANMRHLEQQQVEFFTVAPSHQPLPGSAADREDPTQSVPPERWDELPRNGKKQLDKSAFVYEAAQDVYYCPRGQRLEFSKSERRQRSEGKVRLRVYQCSSCAGCPLASACLSKQAVHGRTITRDEYEEVRERTAARMASPRGQAVYARRFHVGETPFAVLKASLGLRQFLLRGLEGVRTEWHWACTAYNLKKMLPHLGKLRACWSLKAA